jgi:hypothetical protein
MRKLLIILIIIIANINSFSQDVIGSRIIAKQAFFLKDNWVDSLRRDTANWANDFRTLPTTGAVYNFVVGRIGGGTPGLGTVTSVGQAYGILTSPNPITGVGTVRLDSATVFPQIRATIPPSGITDTTNKWIWNQYGAQQTANAWFDSLALKNLRMGNTDSAYLPWFDASETDEGWAYFVGKMADIRDIDTVTAANDDWIYAINANVLLQRDTRLVGNRASAYRQNVVAAQIYEAGDEGGTVYSIGGDLGSALKGYTRITNRTGQTTGRILVNGGGTIIDAVPTLIGSIETAPKASGSTRRAGGYWASVTAYHNLTSGDTLDHWIGFNESGFSNGGKFLSMTGLAIPITGISTMSALNWGVYSPDITGGNSYNLFGGRVGIGDYNFGTHQVPTYKASAALQINSFSRGFITSRMTAAQRLAITADSALFVYDTDSLRYMGYNGGAWKGVKWTSDGIAVGGITGLGTGVATALAINVGSAGAFIVNGGALGTPSSGTLTNATGLPEGGLSLTDITTNNTSTTQHGFFPKLTSNTVYYVSNAGALTALALGANGTVLTSNGATSAPTFTSPAGGGLTVGTTTITSGTDKYALYNNAGVLGNYAAMQFGNTNNNVLVTAQAATDVPLNIKGAASQSAPLLNISSSAGTGDLISVNAAGEILNGGVTDAGAYAFQTTGKGFYAEQVGSGANNIFMTPTSGAGNYFAVQNTGGTKWSIYAGGGMNLELGAASTGVLTFAPGFVNSLTINTSGGLWAKRNIENQGADVASVAGAITVGTDGNAFEITGTNAITLISNLTWQNGAVITLAFTSTATLTDGTANSGTNIGMELAGNTNFVASAGATLTLRLMEIGGTQRWREVARSVQ